LALSATRKAQGDAQAVSDPQGKLDEAHRKETEALAALSTAEQVWLECKKTKTEAECAAEKSTLEQKHREYQVAVHAAFTALVNSMGSVSAAVQSHAQALLTQGVGSLSRPQVSASDEGTNRTLHTIQRKFLENINADAITVACITVLADERPVYDGRASSAQTTFGSLCQSLLPNLIEWRKQLLREKLQASAREQAAEQRSREDETFNPSRRGR
jgi:hypothetical protein